MNGRTPHINRSDLDRAEYPDKKLRTYAFLEFRLRDVHRDLVAIAALTTIAAHQHVPGDKGSGDGKSCALKATNRKSVSHNSGGLLKAKLSRPD